MSELTQSGRLPVGVTVDGVRHRDFTLKPVRVIDNIAAIDEVGSHNQVAVGAAVLARQLTKVGSLKPEEIDYALICEMDPRDYNKLEAAAAELAKKVLPAPDEQETGPESGSPLSGSGLAGETAAS